jgi:hypothetical protein
VGTPTCRLDEAGFNRLARALRSLPSSDSLMNPYASAGGTYAVDSGDEIGRAADLLRLNNLRSYLSALLSRGADVLLVGEAPGHLGARQSGIYFGGVGLSHDSDLQAEVATCR